MGNIKKFNIVSTSLNKHIDSPDLELDIQEFEEDIEKIIKDSQTFEDKIYNIKEKFDEWYSIYIRAKEISDLPELNRISIELVNDVITHNWESTLSDYEELEPIKEKIRTHLIIKDTDKPYKKGIKKITDLFYTINTDEIIEQEHCELNISDKINIIIAINNNYENINFDKKFYWVTNQNNINNEDSLKTILDLKTVIVDGDVIHTPLSDPTSHKFEGLYIDFDEKNYNQFYEIIFQLSEFNAEIRLIPRFMTLYQILENLEIRYVIVDKMQKEQDYKLKVYSFKNIIQKSDNSEFNLLKNLIKAISETKYIVDENINNRRKIGEFIKEAWLEFTNSYSNNLNQLNISFNELASTKERELNFPNYASSISDDNIPTFLAKSIYTLRCSIVHHKTNELHLNDTLLSQSDREILKKFISEFLIPVMYGVITRLLTAPEKNGTNENNSPIYYPSRQILLY